MEAGTMTPTSQAAPPPRLREKYENDVLPAMTEKFGYSTPMDAPKLVKITLNMGLGTEKQDTRSFELAQNQLATIAGQHPNVRRARKSIASFKVREGMPVGVSVTLRRARMWEFLDRLTSIAVPRIRDFRGLNPRSFDGRGNYSMGVKEQLIFPEIDYDSVDVVRGLDVTITTTAKTDLEAFELLLALGMPFAQEGRPGQAEREAAGSGGRRGAAQGGGPPEGRDRAGGAGSAERGEPRGVRQARDRGRGRVHRGRPTTRPARRRPRRVRHKMAKTSQKVRQGRKAKFNSREYNRCRRCGRPRAYYRKFGLCRICLRNAAHEGYIPGMTKSSW